MPPAEARLRLLGLAAGVALGGLLWFVSGELQWPARAMTTFLVAVLPVVLLGQMGAAAEVPDDVSRRLLYRTSSVALWLLALLTALAAFSSGFSAGQLGLSRLPALELVAWTATTAGAGIGSLFLARAFGVRETELLRWLLPRTPEERLEFVGVSITAGVAEELVFRGFLIPALALVSGSWVVAALVSSALFGFVHGYQGAAGTVRAGVLGLLLALPFLSTGSLLPSMAAHTLIDLAGGLWLSERLLRE